MKNPFEYGGVVSGNAFRNREKEVTDLRLAMENNGKLFAFSERRYGKTSLVRRALMKKNPKKMSSIVNDKSHQALLTDVVDLIKKHSGLSKHYVREAAKRDWPAFPPRTNRKRENRGADRS